METISVKGLYEIQQKGQPTVVLDVRSPKEYETVHIANARLNPIDEFDPKQFLENLKKEGLENSKIYVTCGTNPRAKRACHLLIEANHEHVILVDGGTVAWEEAGYPVERNVAAMPLQQQIKLFQGGAVALGSLLGMVWSSIFLIIPLFIGAEMIYSVKTGNSIWSGLFARMPWNL